MMRANITFGQPVAGMGQDLHDALTLLAHGRVQTEPSTRAQFSLTEIQTAFETIRDRPEDLKVQTALAA